MRYIKKPIVIEAIQFKNDEIETINKIQNFMGKDSIRISYKNPTKPCIIISTQEGDMRCNVGDYIIKGVEGEFYPCKPDIFEKTYMKIKE